MLCHPNRSLFIQKQIFVKFLPNLQSTDASIENILWLAGTGLISKYISSKSLPKNFICTQPGPSMRAFSQSEGSPGRRWVEPGAVLDSAESNLVTQSLTSFRLQWREVNPSTASKLLPWELQVKCSCPVRWHKWHTVPNVIVFPRYNMKCCGENVILRGIFHVCSITLSSTFHVISRKFWLFF